MTATELSRHRGTVRQAG